LDINIEKIDIENLNAVQFHTTFCVDIAFLIQIIKDAEIYSDVCIIESIKHKGLEFSSVGNTGEMQYEVAPEDIADLQLTILQNSCDTFALKFLKKITKIHSIAAMVDISLRMDHPLKLNIAIQEGGEVMYFQAPRVESEENEDDQNDTLEG